MTVHDSIVIDIPPGMEKKVIALCKQVCCMLAYKTFDWLKVPLKIDVDIGPTWEGKTDEE